MGAGGWWQGGIVAWSLGGSGLDLGVRSLGVWDCDFGALGLGGCLYCLPAILHVSIAAQLALRAGFHSRLHILWIDLCCALGDSLESQSRWTRCTPLLT